MGSLLLTRDVRLWDYSLSEYDVIDIYNESEYTYLLNCKQLCVNKFAFINILQCDFTPMDLTIRPFLCSHHWFHNYGIWWFWWLADWNRMHGDKGNWTMCWSCYFWNTRYAAMGWNYFAISLYFFKMLAFVCPVIIILNYTFYHALNRYVY